jgi:hypothetical protein
MRIRPTIAALARTCREAAVYSAKGSLTMVLNGVKTVDVQDGKLAQGPFALQFGNGPNDAPDGAIKWRKAQIKAL